LNISDENQIFVMWKGLYEEILVIGRFELCDSDLCGNVVRCIEEREEYEDLIKKFALCDKPNYDQESVNQLN
jgi:hypothetical protein